MNQKKAFILLGIITSIVLTYSVLANYKYATTLMDMFYEETSTLTNIDDQVSSIEDIINKKVSDEEKNKILRKEKSNIHSVGSWFFNLDRYSIANKKIKYLSVDTSNKIIEIIDYINTLIDKDINDFNGEDIAFLKNYKKILLIIKNNSIKILGKREEVFPIPFYTISRIENNIYAIFNAISK